MTFKATAATSAGSTVSNYKRTDQGYQSSIRRRSRANTQDQSYIILYLDIKRTHVEPGDTLLHRVDESSGG